MSDTRSMNSSDSDPRPVLAPAMNKARVSKPATKVLKKVERSPTVAEKKKVQSSTPALSPAMRNLSAPSILRRKNSVSMSGSCSSDASSDSSRASSSGRISRSSLPSRRKIERVEKVDVSVNGGEEEGFVMKKRCAWVTTNTDPLYAKFHDEEWGVPVHDDRKLFELLCYAVALAELTWPTILSKRNLFREVLLDFNPLSVSKLNEKKICAPGTPGSIILSELKLRNIVENARQVCKIIDDFGSFDKYIWNFMNYKPLVNKFRYPRQVPVKISKADVISKDLVRRGFRGVGPTVVYSFMQAAGLTNDHLVTCFRFQECHTAVNKTEKEETDPKVEDEKPSDIVDLELARALGDISICSD